MPINGNEKMVIPSSLFGVVKQKALDMMSVTHTYIFLFIEYILNVWYFNLRSTKEVSIASQLQDLQIQMKQLADKLDQLRLGSSTESTEAHQIL